MCANDIEYRIRIHSLEVQITATTTMTAVTRAASKNVDDPVTDMNHQTLLYTIFGSLDLLIARHTVPSVPYTLKTFESPAVYCGKCDGSNNANGERRTVFTYSVCAFFQFTR